MLKIRMAARSHIGLVRLSNEDNLYFHGTYREGQDLSQVYAMEQELEVNAALFAVCDGMGGEAYGEEAALIAVSDMPSLEDHLSRLGLAGWERRMNEFLEETNAKICKRIKEHEGQRMGTTIVSLFMRGQKAQISNLGDSRIYRYRSGELDLLSIDHTQAQRLADLGIIDQSEVRKHPERHRLLQHLGIFPSEADLKPNISEPFDLQVGDFYLLCSDGLNDNVSEEVIAEALSTVDLDLNAIADDFMEQTLEHGAHDNMTFILLEVLDVGEPSSYDDLAYEGKQSTEQSRVSERADTFEASDVFPQAFERVGGSAAHDSFTPSNFSTHENSNSLLSDTLEIGVVQPQAEEMSKTKPLTEEFIDRVRATSDDTDLQLELGTLPQLYPVRIDGDEDDTSQDTDIIGEVNSPFEDTITSPEPGMDGTTWNKGRIFSQPITTDDLDRFRRAREESLRRQQAYETSLGVDAEPHRKNAKASVDLKRDQRPLIEVNPPTPTRRNGRRYRRRVSYWREVIYFLASVLLGFFLAFLILNLTSLF